MEKMHLDPSVTVLMAVYNGEAYLREAVESILCQTFTDFEFLIVDDGSSDGTANILASYSDSRLRIVRNTRNIGLARSLNTGFHAAKGRYVARLDADDISEVLRLEKQVAFLNAQPDVALLGSWYREVNSGGEVTNEATLPCNHIDLAWELLFYCPFVHSAVMMDRFRVSQLAGPYNESLSYSMDFELWKRIASQWRVANLPEYLVRLRSSPTSMTATYGEKSREGYWMRVSNMAQLTGQLKEDRQVLRRRFDTIYDLFFIDEGDYNINQMISAKKDVLKIQEEFCRYNRLKKEECVSHRRNLRYLLSEKIWERADRLAAEGSWQSVALSALAASIFSKSIFSKRALRPMASLLFGR
jgi:glycosyltransferase involved in cell wall biosynthesis